jgi:molybdopterin converting factor small subunit
MASVHLPSTLPPLFPGLSRHLEIEAATVEEAIARLDERWPGLRDRLCEPGPALRRHINVYVDQERADLGTRLEPRSRLDVIAAISGGENGICWDRAGRQGRSDGPIRGFDWSGPGE